MDEQRRTPIEILTDALAAMTARAMEEEAKLAEQEKRADEWYDLWAKKDKELEETRDSLIAASVENQQLKDRIKAYIREMEAERMAAEKSKGGNGNA